MIICLGIETFESNYRFCWISTIWLATSGAVCLKRRSMTKDTVESLKLISEIPYAYCLAGQMNFNCSFCHKLGSVICLKINFIVEFHFDRLANDVTDDLSGRGTWFVFKLLKPLSADLSLKITNRLHWSKVIFGWG